jgi:hypothetical protein
MTTATFDRATYGAMSVTEMAAAFEEVVGEAPEKRNKLWMLKRMEQAASAQAAARRAATCAAEDDDGAQGDALGAVAVAPAHEESVQEAAASTIAPTAEADDGAQGEEALAVDAAAAAPAQEEPVQEEAPSATPPGTEDDDAAEDNAVVVAAVILTHDEPARSTITPRAEGEARAVVIEEEPGDPAAVADEPATADLAAARAHDEEPTREDEETGEQDGAEAPRPAPEGAPRSADDVAARRHYIPLRFRAMSLPDLHALYLATVGRPTKSIDVPYLAWKIKRAEQKAGTVSAPRRRSVGTDGVPRGEAKAVTLREYPDTLAALEGVCMRHGFRNRLDFFRTAARCYLEEIGEAAAAAYFSAPSAAPPEATPAA